ncbi:MAG: outer membrane lipoprotein-sorting protein [Gammaproteobacteria bacterium]|nr:outer membrane lipoprotein-sorting protein [Gammaproteobacteria bacterium]
MGTMKSASVYLIFVFILLSAPNSVLANKDPSGTEIVKNCDNKYPGEDQQTQLTIILKDRAGNERKNVYLRLWKDMKGKDDILDKMVLFTVYPPDASGAAFMRWAYAKSRDKNAEQWIYLPVLRKIRRVSVRDVRDSFLGSDLTYGDISYRGVDEDEHKLIDTVKDKTSGQELYVVESISKGKDPQYSKRHQFFTKTPNWDSCVKVRVDYYDSKNAAFLKRQFLTWQKVDKAWVWDKVFVQNIQTQHSSQFEVEKVKINRGLDDSLFTERRMQLGIK